MSYNLSLSFKNCKKEDIYTNLEQLSNLLLENAEEYIENNYYFLIDCVDSKKDKWDNRIAVRNKIKNLFRLHCWYCEDIQSLCVVWGSNIKAVNDWFDGYVYFQNSTDQDYDYDEWNFNGKFAENRDKIVNMSDKEFVYYFLKDNVGYSEKEIKKDIEYHKKTKIYEENYCLIEPIWEKGIGVGFIDGALDQTPINLTNLFFRIMEKKEKEVCDD